MAALTEVVAFLDETLRTSEIPDYPPALNGLQFGNRGGVTHVAAAVDYSSTTVQAAAELGADMLIVHHGMFWEGLARLTGARYERLALLVENGIAVYSSHLPLDVHPALGNNALMAEHLALTPSGGFAKFSGMEIGLRGECDRATSELVESLRAMAKSNGGEVVSTPFEPEQRTRRWGICTGAGASSETLLEAIEQRVDTLIVGEGPHHTAVQARDLGITVLYAGHYATETFGVRAVAELLASTFAVEASFVDAPTGL